MLVSRALDHTKTIGKVGAEAILPSIAANMAVCCRKMGAKAAEVNGNVYLTTQLCRLLRDWHVYERDAVKPDMHGRFASIVSELERGSTCSARARTWGDPTRPPRSREASLGGQFSVGC